MPKVTIGNRGIVTEAGSGFHVDHHSALEQIEEVRVLTTEAATLRPYGVSSITTVGGASGVITLPNGTHIGQQKLIVLTSDGGDAAVTVSKHVTSDDEVFTAADAGDTLMLIWQGVEWVTVANHGWAT